MKRPLLVVIAVAGCDGGADPGPDAIPPLAALDLPAVIALPYVEAGAGATTIEVTVTNQGGRPLDELGWTLEADLGFGIVEAPLALGPGEQGALVLRWDGAGAETIAGGTLTTVAAGELLSAELWAVAGDPAIGAADFAEVTGAGGAVIGRSAVVSMPTAPFPHQGDPWTDDRVHLFVPDGYREAGGPDVVLHFHGHSTTIDATVPAHRYREQVYASGANVILAVPQGPVNAASGDFGKLDDPSGTEAFLRQVRVVLYREGLITRPEPGQLVLTAHSGGYAAVGRNLGAARLPVAQVGLYDALYGFLDAYQGYVLDGGRLRSNYTATGGTDDNNRALADDLEATGLPVATAPAPRALLGASAVIYPTGGTHNGATRDDGAFGEQLRWGAPRSRRGPRVELRSVTADGDAATLRWLSPPDADLMRFRIETWPDGGPWTLRTEIVGSEDSAVISLGEAVRARVVPVVEGVALDDAQPSDAYRVAPGADVLIVDGFDRVVDGSWGGLAHDLAARVGEAAGPVHTASAAAVAEDDFPLGGYRVVIWLVGDDSTADHTFTAAEQQAISQYLDGGGRVILSGSEIGFDLGAGGWIASVAGASYATDDAATNLARGAGPLAALAAFGFGGDAAPYPEEYPDTFTTTGAGTVILAYGDGAGAAVGIAGRAAIVGFPLETIESDAALRDVVAALLAFVE